MPRVRSIVVGTGDMARWHIKSMIELKRAMGTLLQYELIGTVRTTDGCLPRLQVAKQPPLADYESLPPAADDQETIKRLPLPEDFRAGDAAESTADDESIP